MQADQTRNASFTVGAAALAIAVAAWALLAWLALDMAHPLARLTMPGGAWSAVNAIAVFVMWAVMMAAMMLPSALPMIATFVGLSRRNGEPSRGHAFVAAYLVVWSAFSVAATAAQWALQAPGWVDPMIVSTSPALTAALLLVAGAYQFSPLKRLCLSHCRTPIGFLMGCWRPGARGAFAMGLRHGVACVGCCWALMALLFVGGAMNLAWVAALAVAVGVEKTLPGGQRMANALGVLLIAAGALKLVALW
jgi:predicted metal-binding membrane protein